jgi:drug/metabolite transporter (DMT)-like permease
VESFLAVETPLKGLRHSWLVRGATLLLPPVIWAAVVIVSADVVRDMAPAALAFWSWSFALLAMLPFAARGLYTDWPVLRKEWPRVAVLGVCGTAWFQYLWLVGLTIGQPVSVTIVTATLPTMVAVAAWVLLRELPWRPVALACLLTLVGGIVLASGKKGGGFGRGEMLVLFANLLMVAYTLGARMRSWNISGLSFMTIVTAGGVFSFLPFAALTGGLATDAMATHWKELLYLSVVSYFLAYLAWNYSLIVNGVTRTAFALALQPLLAIGFAAVFLGAKVTAIHIVALVATLAGFIVAIRADNGQTNLHRQYALVD